jgi:hypothetical protein
MAERVIHIFCPSSSDPSHENEYQQNIQSWKVHHPDWNTEIVYPIVWETLIRQHPTTSTIVPHMSNTLQRMNLAKYLISYLYGGLCVDVNVQCMQTLEFVTAYSCVLFEHVFLEKEYIHLHIPRYRKAMMLTSVMYSIRQHGFWVAAITAIKRNIITYSPQATVELKVLQDGGGVTLHDAKTQFVGDITIFDSSLVSPFSWVDAPCQKCKTIEACKNNFPKSFALHQPLYENGSLWMPFSNSSYWMNTISSKILKNRKMMIFIVGLFLMCILWMFKSSAWVVVKKAIGATGTKLISFF